MRSAGDVSRVIELFCRFFANAADQFAFARLAGIMHGAVSPSNQCLDGRWIDLTNTSFVNPAENYAGGNRQSAAFHEEANEPIGIGAELIAQFCKFNCHQIAIQPFIDYYRSCLNDRFTAHLDYICGLSRGGFFKHHGHIFLHSLSKKLLSEGSDGPVIYDRWPTDPPKDEPIFETIASLFVAASSEKMVQVDALHKSSFADTWGSSFREILLESKLASVGFDSPYHFFCIASAIAAAKRLLLTPFFYKGRIETIVCQLLENNQIDRLEGYIGEVINVSNWVLSLNSSRHVVIVELPRLVINFDAVTGEYAAVTNASEKIIFRKPQSLLEWCERHNPRTLEIGDFSFLPYLRRVLGLVHNMNMVSNHAT